MDTVGKEIASICNQNDQAALEFGKSSNEGIFQDERSADADDDTDQEAGEENQQEDANSLEEADNAEIAGRAAIFVPLGGFEQNNGDCVIEDGFAKDDSVQLGFHLVKIEDGEDGDRVGGR